MATYRGRGQPASRQTTRAGIGNRSAPPPGLERVGAEPPEYHEWDRRNPNRPTPVGPYPTSPTNDMSRPPAGYTRTPEWWAEHSAPYDRRGTGEGHIGLTFGPEGRNPPPGEFATWGERGNDRRMREKMGLPPNPASSGWHPESMPAPYGRYPLSGGPKPMPYKGVEGAGYYPTQEEWHRMYPTDVGNEWLGKFGGAPGGGPYYSDENRPDPFQAAGHPGYNTQDYGPGAYTAPNYQYGRQEGDRRDTPRSAAELRALPGNAPGPAAAAGIPRPTPGPFGGYGAKQQGLISTAFAGKQGGFDTTQQFGGRTIRKNKAGKLVDITDPQNRQVLTNMQGQWLPPEPPAAAPPPAQKPKMIGGGPKSKGPLRRAPGR